MHWMASKQPIRPHRWATRRILLLILFCCGALCIPACGSPTPEPTDVELDVEFDAADEGDVADTHDVAIADDDPGHDADVEDISTDADAYEDAQPCGQQLHEPCPRPERSTYICNAAGDEISYPAVDAGFTLPNTNTSYDPPYGDSFLERANSSGAVARTTLTPAPHHTLMVERPWTIAAERGEDITLHAGLWRDGGPFEDAHLVGTILLDYEPVEARYTVRDYQRQNVLEEVVGTGVKVPVHTEVVLVDITIPASAFAEDRAYELASFLEVASPGKTHVADVTRTGVFYQGYSRKAHPCYSETTAMVSTDEEMDVILGFGGVSSMRVYPEGEAENPRATYQVAPGETLSINFFQRAINSNLIRPVVLQPVFDGEPIDSPMHVEPAKYDRAAPDHRIDLRGSLELQAPAQPGLYPMFIAGFTDAHLIPVDHRGIFYSATLSSPYDSSNTIWYEVVEPE